MALDNGWIKDDPMRKCSEVKCSLNVSHTGTVGELSKAHHHELVSATELNGVSVASVAADTLPGHIH